MQVNSSSSVRSPFVPPFAICSFVGSKGVYVYTKNFTGEVPGIVYTLNSITLPTNGVFRPSRVILYGSGTLTSAVLRIKYDGDESPPVTLDITTSIGRKEYDKAALLIYNIPTGTSTCKELDLSFSLAGRNVIIRHCDIEHTAVE